jgi:ribose transport system permease protein
MTHLAPELDTPGEQAGGSRATGRRRQGATIDVVERVGIFGAWAAVILVFGLVEPSTFLSIATARNILGSDAVLVMLALGLILPMTAGEYDLSIAAILALSSVTVAVLNAQDHFPIVLAVLIGIAVGAFAGLVNGIIMVYFDIESLVVTLGMSTVLGGIVLWMTNSLTISGVSPALVDAADDHLLGLPLVFVYALVLTVLLWYVLHYLPVGRRVLFAGRGREVARLSGVRVNRVRLGVMVASGLFAGVAGVLYTGVSGSANPTAGATLLLPAFAAVFLGSTTIVPGRFNAWGTIVAVYFLTTGTTGLELLGVSAWVEQLFYGAALIGAVIIRQLVRRRITAGPRRPARATLAKAAP